MDQTDRTGTELNLPKRFVEAVFCYPKMDNHRRDTESFDAGITQGDKTWRL